MFNSQSGFLSSGRSVLLLILVSAIALLLNLRETGSLWPGAQDTSPRTLQQVDMMASLGCDAAEEACVVIAGDFVVRVQMGPGVAPLQPFDMLLTVQNGAVEMDDVTVSFAMRDMDMGLNRYRMLQDSAGRWSVKATLPVCTRQRTDWLAQVEIVAQDTLYVATIPFHTESQ